MKFQLLFKLLLTLQMGWAYQMYDLLPPSVNVSDPSVTHLDWRTDAVQPTSQEVKQKMTAAKTGIEFFFEDPTALELEKLTAKMLGKEAAVFMPSATMGNLVAALVYCKGRSSELVVGDNYHIFRHEEGNVARFGGINVNAIPVLPDGTFNLTDLNDRISYRSGGHKPEICLIATENTNNFFGGLILPQKWIDQVVKMGQENKIPIHMDGARLFHSVVATGMSAERITKGVSSITISLCKLGGIMGAMLAGDKTFVDQAREVRNGLGGGMTQVGFIAASGINTLQNNINRLAEDQRNAKEFATKVHKTISASDMALRLMTVTDQEKKKLGASIKILNWPRGTSNIRIVFKAGVTKECIDKGIKKIRYVVQGCPA